MLDIFKVLVTIIVVFWGCGKTKSSAPSITKEKCLIIFPLSDSVKTNLLERALAVEIGTYIDWSDTTRVELFFAKDTIFLTKKIYYFGNEVEQYRENIHQEKVVIYLEKIIQNEKIVKFGFYFDSWKTYTEVTFECENGNFVIQKSNNNIVN